MSSSIPLSELDDSVLVDLGTKRKFYFQNFSHENDTSKQSQQVRSEFSAKEDQACGWLLGSLGVETSRVYILPDCSRAQGYVNNSARIQNEE